MALLLLVIPASSQAPRTKIVKAECNDTRIVFDYLVKEYKEAPIINSDIDTGSISIWANPTEKTMTVVFTSKDLKESCIIVGSINFQIVDQSVKI